MNETQAKPGTSRRRNVLVPVLVAAVAAVIAVGIALAPTVSSHAEKGTGGPANTSAQGGAAAQDPAAQEAATQLEQLARRTPHDPMALGKVDAPVVMVAYSEFQCPFCGKFSRDTEPTLIKQFVDTGVLRIEWRDFPYLGPESTTAARAGRAAAAQGKFWPLHDALFAHQTPVNGGKLTVAYLAGVAKDVGLDVGRFRTDMASAGTLAAVQKDFGEGQSIGVTGTPAFLINGEPIIGAQPTSTFVAAVEKAAAAAR